MNHEHFRGVLNAKAAELTSALRRRDGLNIETETDQFDEMQQGAERDLTISNLHRDTALLKNVRAALDRLSNGSFGICLHCQEPIGPKRLAALPWAALCLPCQQLADAGETDCDDSAPSPAALVRTLRSALHG